MSKPRIYGTCDAGCLWEVPHKEDTDAVAGNVTKILDGSTVVPKAYKDGEGNVISQTYVKTSTALPIKVFVDSSSSLSSSARITIGTIPNGKSLMDITFLSVKLYDNYRNKTDCFYGLKTATTTLSDLNGKYIDFVCQQVQTAENTTVYENTTQIFRLYNIDGILSIQMGERHGFVVDFDNSNEITRVNGWVTTATLKCVGVIYS